MPHVTTLLVALKVVTLALGGLITFYAYRAARRTGARSLWLLTYGFGLVTLGSLVAGAVHQGVGLDTSVVLVVESAFTAVGFAVILYSLHAD
ncbi:MAG: hypothetical protein ABEJ06_01725 [Haloarculaceae archaeon]